MGDNFCSEHECIKTQVEQSRNNRKFWQRILDSKMFYFVATGIIILCLMFVGWTVNEIYAQKANEKESRKAAEIICEKVSETKAEIKEIKEEMKKDNEKRNEERMKDQEKLMKILLSIQREVKK